MPAAAPSDTTGHAAAALASLSLNERVQPCGTPVPPFEKKKSDTTAKPMAPKPRRLESAGEGAAEAAVEYEGLLAQADQECANGDPKAAIKLAKAAIKLMPDEPEAYFALGMSYELSGEGRACTSECFLTAVEHSEPDSRTWAVCICKALERLASDHTFACTCGDCVRLKPAWMTSPQSLVAVADRVVAAAELSPVAWEVHAQAHDEIDDLSTALKSYRKAGKLYAVVGNTARKERVLHNAKLCLEELGSPPPYNG